mgnify:CR=1
MKYNNKGCEIVINISLNFILFFPWINEDNMLNAATLVNTKKITER